MYFQISKRMHRIPWCIENRRTEPGVIYVLILKPTSVEDSEFVRIGVAEIPCDDGMADGWPQRTVKGI
jgi:hypothetical protein